ncbi:MAG: hypothetical protein D6705_01970 [Deltaproteobacteria bacterium]|nr:MAG: hypothetical protein D6705_01970 [Deltaproteobacteria bacterium]
MGESGRRYYVAVAAIVAIGALARAGVLGHGLAVDDFAQVAMVDGTYPVRRAPWDLYRFSSGALGEVARLREVGALAWWSDDGLRFAALRPLGSLLRAAEIRWFGADATFLAHLHGLAWWAGAVVAFAALARRLVPATVALTAVALHACEEGHGVALSWIANRPALMAATFGSMALAEYVRADGARPVRLATWTFLALACGEYALAVPVFALGLEATVGRNAGSRRWPRCAAVFVPALAYLAVHRALGYGARGSGIYVDPLADPGAFVSAAVVRVPVLLADGIAGVGADAVAVDPARAPAVAAVGGLAAVFLFAVGWFLFADPSRRRAWVVGAGCLVAVLLLHAGAFVSTRLWVVPGPALALGLAALVVALVERVRRGAAGRGWAAAFAVVLTLLHGPVALGRSVFVAEGYGRANTAAVAALRHSDVGDVAGRDVVVYAAVDPTTLLYGRYLVGRNGPPRSWLVLSAVPASLRLRRPTAGRIELDVAGPLGASPLERLFRPGPPPIDRGVEVAAGRVTPVRPTRSTEGEAATIRFDFDPARPPVFLVTTRTALRRLAPPPVGGAVDLPLPVAPLRTAEAKRRGDGPMPSGRGG